MEGADEREFQLGRLFSRKSAYAYETSKAALGRGFQLGRLFSRKSAEERDGPNRLRCGVSIGPAFQPEVCCLLILLLLLRSPRFNWAGFSAGSLRLGTCWSSADQQCFNWAGFSAGSLPGVILDYDAEGRGRFNWAGFSAGSLPAEGGVGCAWHASVSIGPAFQPEVCLALVLHTQRSGQKFQLGRLFSRKSADPLEPLDRKG